MNHDELLYVLRGEWIGEGHVRFPTVAPFEYIETLRFSADERPIIQYEQKTQRRNSTEPRLISSHWEFGFIHLMENGRVVVNNTQSGGRVEVLQGTVQKTYSGIIMELHSTSFLNDLRSIETSRVLEVDRNQLHYTMHLRTNSVTDLMMHLEAELSKR